MKSFVEFCNNCAPWSCRAPQPSLLAFFAFTGFEGLANIAEEVKRPARTKPIAIFFTLAFVTLLYVLVVWVQLVTVPVEELSQTAAPLSLVYERVTGASPAAITAIAIAATINGIVVSWSWRRG